MRDERWVRWRLLLGSASGVALDPRAQLSQDDLARDAALAWLYERGQGLADRDVIERAGGLEGSSLTVPTWINEVHRLFPKETIERLERDAVETYQLTEVVTNPEVLRRLPPSETLLRAVLHTKHLMNPATLAMARELVAKVVRQLIDTLKPKVRKQFHGARNRRRSWVKQAKDFDAKGTVRANLAHYRREERKLGIKTPLFLSRTKKHFEQWQIILLVDESGSMMGSVIHAAVTAACLWGLPATKTHLCIFDTEVVDLTPQVTDPVEVLMRVQLGGGTDIGKAVAYGASLVENPRRTIFVVISDFFEGALEALLVSRLKSLLDQGVTVLGLLALDEAANPAYNQDLAKRLAKLGARMGAMTPSQLVDFVAEALRR